MRGEIRGAGVMVIVLLVLSVITASVVMAETLKYIPFPQEISDEFYYTDIDTTLRSEIDSIKHYCGVEPVYGEEVAFPSGGIVVIEFSSAEDTKKKLSVYTGDR